MSQDYKEIHTFKISEIEAGERLDVFLKEKLPNLSRTRIKNLIENSYILVNTKISKPSYKIKPGDIIEVRLPYEKEIELKPQEVEFEILYEDNDIAVINKPAGLVVHPAPGHYENTLVHGLLLRLKNLSGIGGKLRPGIVHRLDKDTSGIMLIAKNDFSHNTLVTAFKNKEIEKEYIAICYGIFKMKKGKIETFLGRHPVNRKKIAVLKEGKLAITLYEVIEEYNKKTSLVLAKPVTGRTHQIRVHLSYLGHPIIGDPVYGGLKHGIPKPKRLMLHSYRISFVHPRTKKEMRFEAPIPEDFQEYIKCLKNLNPKPNLQRYKNNKNRFLSRALLPKDTVT